VKIKFSVKALILLLSAQLLVQSGHAQAAAALSFTSTVPAASSPLIRSTMGTSAAVFNGQIYLAFQSKGGNYLWISTSSDGTTYTDPGTSYKSIQMAYAPSIATYNDALYVAYTTSTGSVDVITSTDGVNFSTPVAIYTPGTDVEVPATGPPSLVVYAGELFAFWEADYPDSNQIKVASTSNGQTWYESVGYGCQYTAQTNPGVTAAHPISGAAIGTAVLNDNLYVASEIGNKSINGSNELLVCSTAHGWNYYPYIYPGSGISAAVHNGSLYLAFKYNEGHTLEMTGSEDGYTFTTPVTSYSGIQINGSSEIAPSLVDFNNVLYVYSISNDSEHNIIMDRSE